MEHPQRFAREKGHEEDGLGAVIEQIEARGATAVLVGDAERLHGVTLLVTFNALRLLRPGASSRLKRPAGPALGDRMGAGALTHGH